MKNGLLAECPPPLPPSHPARGRADLPCDQEAIRLGTCLECDNGRRRRRSTEPAANKDHTSSAMAAVVVVEGEGWGGGLRSAAGEGGLEADV